MIKPRIIIGLIINSIKSFKRRFFLLYLSFILALVLFWVSQELFYAFYFFHFSLQKVFDNIVYPILPLWSETFLLFLKIFLLKTLGSRLYLIQQLSCFFLLSLCQNFGFIKIKQMIDIHTSIIRSIDWYHLQRVKHDESEFAGPAAAARR